MINRYPDVLLYAGLRKEGNQAVKVRLRAPDVSIEVKYLLGWLSLLEQNVALTLTMTYLVTRKDALISTVTVMIVCMARFLRHTDFEACFFS